MNLVKENDIYWANALFTDADRMFNTYCAAELRKVGYTVYLPQEAPVNQGAKPSSYDIFRNDTSAILKSRVLVACIDQETIDSGVACEIGIAYSYGVPVIGLYTDIRQHRSGIGHMYKNLYVIGAIEDTTPLVSSVEELLKILPHHVGNRKNITCDEVNNNGIVPSHYNGIAQIYEDFVRQLESCYEPQWQPVAEVLEWVKRVLPKRILEVGPGTGSIANAVCEANDVFYMGYDISRVMTTIAGSVYGSDRCMFTPDANVVRQQALQEPFDMVLALFTLHDHADKRSTISLVDAVLRPGGYFILVDLSTDDLPRLTELLRVELGRPARCVDPRLNLVWLSTILESTGLELIECHPLILRIHFPSSHTIDQYLDIFGIYKGFDLPLGLTSPQHIDNRLIIRELLSKLNYPFMDYRIFIAGTMKKR